MRTSTILTLLLASSVALNAQTRIQLDSQPYHNGIADWKMALCSSVCDAGEIISSPGYDDSSWMEAIIPGTVLNTLVHNKVYPEPYYGVNNKIETGLIPDLAKVGRDFYAGWFRTEFPIPSEWSGKRVWLQLDGINYRAEVWVNSHLLATMGGMFRKEIIDISNFSVPGETTAVAVKVFPVDTPGTLMPKRWGAVGEWNNGGDGNIGLNTTMLMSVGWDFTFMDGIRDRNTGIWKPVSVYSTGDLVLRDPFVRSDLNEPTYDISRETVSVTILNPGTSFTPLDYTLEGIIEPGGIRFSQSGSIQRGIREEVTFSPEVFPQLIIKNPSLWWPVNKGPQNLYNLKLVLSCNGEVCDSLETTFGIREITSDQKTPDNSRRFYVNGRPLFIRGSNWIPEAMLRMTPERTEAELRYTAQSGVNMLRLWGGGIEESPRFYELCDSLGILVWQEFWMTGDTKHPQDQPMYLANVASTVKNIRNHPSLAYYVDSNESTEVSGMRELLENLDGTRGYQMQSECDGVHDGSPYKQVNPMCHYENTASKRGSRVDGFNPEYGSPCLPLVQELREMMSESDLWPINKEVWDYLDGNGFSLVTSLYKELTDQYGESSSIEEFARKAQALGIVNYKSIWEVWNYNKFAYGDRWASGVLFWYHNSAIRHVGSMMWDWSLEPMASLYAAANALEPLHAQFDFLKNSVSVVNDYYHPFKGKVKAEIYGFDSRKLYEKSASVDIPEDGVACDVLELEFPESISQVHFIKLRLFDSTGKTVSENFYWRSKDKYRGADTVSGPCASGFQDLDKLPATRLRVRKTLQKEAGRDLVCLEIRNTGKKLAFICQAGIFDSNGSHIRPSFFSDNFFSLLPGESRTITIETPPVRGARLEIKAWNTEKIVINL